MSILIREARPHDAGAIGNILWRFQNDTLWMPKLYSGAEVLKFCEWMIQEGIVRVATRAGEIKGFIARRNEEILSLYLDASARGQGIGTALIQDAQRHSARLELWTFQANLPAQAFYRALNCHEINRSDGAHNDEKLPDIMYEWRQNP